MDVRGARYTVCHKIRPHSRIVSEQAAKKSAGPETEHERQRYAPRSMPTWQNATSERRWDLARFILPFVFSRQIALHVAAGMTATCSNLLAASSTPTLSGYASEFEFSVCHCGSNMWCNRVNSDKLIDPGWLLQRKRNAWSRLTPDS